MNNFWPQPQLRGDRTRAAYLSYMQFATRVGARVFGLREWEHLTKTRGERKWLKRSRIFASKFTSSLRGRPSPAWLGGDSLPPSKIGEGKPWGISKVKNQSVLLDNEVLSSYADSIADIRRILYKPSLFAKMAFGENLGLGELRKDGTVHPVRPQNAPIYRKSAQNVLVARLCRSCVDFLPASRFSSKGPGRLIRNVCKPCDTRARVNRRRARIEENR